jgi:hypothetical protein
MQKINITNNKEREDIEQKAAALLQMADLPGALRLYMFVLDWDKYKENVLSQISTLSNLRIIYSQLSKEAQDVRKKKEMADKALEVITEALNLADSNNIESSVLLVYQVLTKFENAMELDETPKRRELRDCLNCINDAIVHLPGSKAYKAWPANLKAKIQSELQEIEAAMDTLDWAEKMVYFGYLEEFELAAGDAVNKINLWLANLYLTRIDLFIKSGRLLLAKNYANYVISIEGSAPTLLECKKEAQKVVGSLK